MGAAPFDMGISYIVYVSSAHIQGICQTGSDQNMLHVARAVPSIRPDIHCVTA